MLRKLSGCTEKSVRVRQGSIHKFSLRIKAGTELRPHLFSIIFRLARDNHKLSQLYYTRVLIARFI